MRCKRRSRKHDFGKKRFDTKTPYFYLFIPFFDDQNFHIYTFFFNKNFRLNLFYPLMLLLLFVWMLFSLFPQKRRICIIASSTDELVLKCPECVNLHREFYKDPFWDRAYIMCTSTTCYLTSTTSCAKKRFQIIFLTLKFIPMMFWYFLNVKTSKFVPRVLSYPSLQSERGE